MIRSPRKYKLSSNNQYQNSSYNAKQLLKMSSSLIKNFLQKNQQSYLQSKNRRPNHLQSTTASSTNVEQVYQTTKKIEVDNLEELAKKNPVKVGYKQRHSYRMLENKNVRQNQSKESGFQRANKQKTSQKGIKISTSPESDFKITPKWEPITPSRSNILKRKVNKSLQRKTPMGNRKQRLFQSTEYYIDDIKSSVSEFIKNQEYNNPHLSHLIESLSTFKMFSYSYLPKNPQRVLSLPFIQQGKITLVFDLDETLLHSQVADWDYSTDDLQEGEIVEINSPEHNYRVCLRIRPFAVEVLTRLKQHFQVGIFTAAQEHYASQLIKVIDPQDKIFTFKLYRPHCQQMHSRVSYIKDLRVLGNREMSRVVLIDNSPQSYLFQKSNGIPITSFYNDKQDKQLLKLQKFLMQMLKVSDVRVVLQNYFKLQKYSRFHTLGKLVQQLY